MRKFRSVAAAAITTAVIAGLVPSPARAATTGAGTARAATSVLQVAVGTDGSLLNVRLLGDDSVATIDKAASVFTRLGILDVASSLVPGLKVSVPGVEAKSPGGSPSVGVPAIDLASPVSTGSLSPATVSAILDGASAKGGLGTTLSNLTLVGGLLSAPKITSSLGTSAVGSSSDGLRGLDIESLNVLDLGALLDGLGLGLLDMPLSVIDGLLGQLGLPVPSLANGVSVESAVDEIMTAIDEVQTLLGTVAGTVDGATSTALGTILGGLGSVVPAIDVPVPTVGATVDTLNDTINGLQGQLRGLLGTVVATLDGVALLSVQDVKAGLDAKAGATMADTVAKITASIGSIKVGGVALPGLDLGATVEQVSGLLNQVTGTIDGVLGSINPGLAGLVKLKVLDRQSGTSTSADGYNHATASLTALTASIVPPANLAAIVSTVAGLTNSVGDILGQLGGTLPVVSTAMSTLEGALGSVQALAGGATIKVAELTAAADYSPQAVPVTAPGGDLPRTGGPAFPIALLGVLFIAAAVAIDRWFRSNAASSEFSLK
jgi:hypothetical protein